MLLALRANVVAVTTSLAILQLTCSPLGPIETTVGEFAPETITAIVSATLRPTLPADLGDQNDQTGAGALTTTSPSTGTQVITATNIADAPAGSVGAIEYVVFYVRGSHDEGNWTSTGADGRPIMDDVTAERLKWSVGASTASAPITPLGFADDAADFRNRSSGPILTQPNGNPWTWAALNALVNFKWEIDYNLPAFSILGSTAAEMWVEVYGTGGAGNPRRKIHFRMALGIDRSALQVGLDRTKLPTPGPMRFRVPV